MTQLSDGTYEVYNQPVEVNGLDARAADHDRGRQQPELRPDQPEDHRRWPMEGDDPGRPERHRELRTVGRARSTGASRRRASRSSRTGPRANRSPSSTPTTRSKTSSSRGCRSDTPKIDFTAAGGANVTPTLTLGFWPFSYLGGLTAAPTIATSNSAGPQMVVGRDQARRRAGVRIRAEERRPEGCLRRHLAGDRDACAADPQPVRVHDRDRAEERRSRLPGGRRHRAQHLDRRRRLPAVDLAVGRRQRGPMDGQRRAHRRPPGGRPRGDHDQRLGELHARQHLGARGHRQREARRPIRPRQRRRQVHLQRHVHAQGQRRLERRPGEGHRHDLRLGRGHQGVRLRGRTAGVRRRLGRLPVRRRQRARLEHRDRHLCRPRRDQRRNRLLLGRQLQRLQRLRPRAVAADPERRHLAALRPLAEADRCQPGCRRSCSS